MTCRATSAAVEEEIKVIANEVAVLHSGRNRGDRSRFERCGVNVKTMLKYMQVLRLWIFFCAAKGCFLMRWDHAALDSVTWGEVASLWYSNSTRGSLADSSLESYMRMLSHVLIVIAGDPSDFGRLHAQQRDIIQRVVDAHCQRNPICRTVRNTKAAWDDVLIDSAMQLLLQWNVYGHCYKSLLAWPSFARMAFAMLNYLGWRPMSLTRDRVDKHDARWANHPVCSFGQCLLAWDCGVLVSAQVHGVRTKFLRNPRQELDSAGVLRDRAILDGKLTYSDVVDTCPVLAWMVWAVVCGVFGYKPLVAEGMYVKAGHVEDGGGFANVDEVDDLVESIFTIQPDRVPHIFQSVPVFTAKPLEGGVGVVCTDRLSNAIHVVGVRLGLDPRKCSAISARKTLATAVVLHPETTDLDCTRTFGHVNPRLTTQAVYTEASARTADSRAIMRHNPVRQLPGSVQMAHRRNLSPDIASAEAAGKAASAAFRLQHALHPGDPQLEGVRALNAYKKAFRCEMQRQYDAQAVLPRAGGTREQLGAFFFTPIACQGMSQAEFVAWQVKVALGILPSPRSS